MENRKRTLDSTFINSIPPSVQEIKPDLGSQCTNLKNFVINSSVCMELQQKFMEQKELGPHFAIFGHYLRPFNLEWCYGINPYTDIKNLGKQDDVKVFFTSSNVAGIYDLESNEVKILEGHQNTINSISSDEARRYVVTADKGKSNTCAIVWDTQGKEPIFTLFDLNLSTDHAIVTFSPNAKYLLTLEVIDNSYSLKVWLWTSGSDTPADVFQIENQFGAPRKICFNQQLDEHFMLIFEKEIFFFLILEDDYKFVQLTQIANSNLKKYGIFTMGTYGVKSHYCFSVTSHGHICIYGNTLYYQEYKYSHHFNNTKNFINAVKVSNVAITCIEPVEKLIVIGTANGHIYLFNHQISLLFWFEKFHELGAITSISFDLVDESNLVCRRISRKIKEGGSIQYTCMEADNMTNLIENAPIDATINPKPFIIKPFLVSTSNGNIYAINQIKDTCTPLFHIIDDNISAVETHTEKPYLLIAMKNGRISLFDYETNHQIFSINLSTTLISEGQSKKMDISCLKYCYKSFHLICGTATGEIFILDPILLKPKIEEPFSFGEHRIVKIVFSYNSCEFAYYDVKNMVYLLNYNSTNDEWSLKGFTKAHYKPISDILFYNRNGESILCTIGEDRQLIEYKDPQMIELRLEERSCTRIEQSAIPLRISYFEREYDEGRTVGYFLIVDDQHKYKILSIDTKVTRAVYLAPAFGCFRDKQILNVNILKNGNYFIFATDQHLGLQMLPIDGNPYTYLGYLGHINGVGGLVTSHDDRFLFTFGKNDGCVFKWRLREKAVDILSHMGGGELEPYYCLIEGGRYGWLFQEIMDLYFYIQILEQADDVSQVRVVSDYISVTELPDLMRACGYFPSEFEIENFMIDIKYRDFDENGTIRNKINFIDFIKLFINHKPAYGNSLKQYSTAFKTVTNVRNDTREVSKAEELVLMLSLGGERMTEENILSCFKILMKGKENSEIELTEIPEEVFLNDTFVKVVLGFESEGEETIE